MKTLLILTAVSSPERVRIAAASDSSPRTVDRAYRGERIHETTRARITRAARELGLPAPPAAVAACPTADEGTSR